MNHAPTRASIRVPSPDFLAAVLAHIEAHLFEALSVARLAQVAGLSPWHFSRAFTARFGESVMGYVRGRRLDAAAFKLMSAAPPALIDLAFDCGFESQEAFTRAFGRRFGRPPGEFKRRASKRAASETVMTGTAPARVERMPELLRRAAFTVAGLRAVFDNENKHGIPALWPRLIECLPLPGQAGGKSYGVSWMADRNEGAIHYLAGVEVTGDAALPPGFERVNVPANAYAVFRLHLDGPDIHPQVQAAMPEIWGEGLKRAGLKVVQAPDFELYPEGFNPVLRGAYFDVCVPVEG